MNAIITKSLDPLIPYHFTYLISIFIFPRCFDFILFLAPVGCCTKSLYIYEQDNERHYMLKNVLSSYKWFHLNKIKEQMQ